VVICLVLVFLAGLVGVEAYVYFFNTKIIKSSLITNEIKLKQYLGIAGISPKRLKYKTDNGQYLKVSSIIFFRHNEWKETGNCIGTRGSERIFCFDESLNNGQMTTSTMSHLLRGGL
jgi:hypothetical protein